MVPDLATIIAVYAVARLIQAVIEFRPAKDAPGAVKAWIAMALVSATAIVLIAAHWKHIVEGVAEPRQFR